MKNMGKVRRMNVNAEDKKGDIEKEKDTDRKENKAREAGYNKNLRPATVATARETREDHQETENVPPTEDHEDIQWDYNEDGEIENDNLPASQALPLPVNQGCQERAQPHQTGQV